MTSKKIIAANWKMNKTADEAEKFVKEFLPLVKKTNAEIVLCPPFTALAAAGGALRGSGVKLGGQNLHGEERGAYTGEVSGEMLKELGAEYVIVGHSERRQYFGEDDAAVNKKVLRALTCGLIPIICVGETLPERESGKTEKVLARQIAGAFAGLNDKNIVIAYEPVWAIGTGKTATTEQADETIKFIKDEIKRVSGYAVRVLYGGSMNEKNAAELLAAPHIDGGLIGGAGLDPHKLAEIARYA